VLVSHSGDSARPAKKQGPPGHVMHDTGRRRVTATGITSADYYPTAVPYSDSSVESRNAQPFAGGCPGAQRPASWAWLVSIV